jgi:hypothetical protein
MGADTGFHADPAWRQVGEPRFHLATRPFLPQHDRTTPIVPNDVKRALADIDADHGYPRIDLLRHGVSLSLLPLASFAGWQGGSTAGPSH